MSLNYHIAVVELPHWLYCSWITVCWSQGAVRLGWYPGCRMLQPAARIPTQPNRTLTPTHGNPRTAAGSPDTTPAEPHPNSKTQQPKNNTANVVVQQHSRKLLKMDILMLETC